MTLLKDWERVLLKRERATFGEPIPRELADLIISAIRFSATHVNEESWTAQFRMDDLADEDRETIQALSHKPPEVPPCIANYRRDVENAVAILSMKDKPRREAKR